MQGNGMKLIGSKPSPFTRRLRILLEDTNYELKFVDVFSPEGKELVYSLSPTGRVPLLVMDDNVLWDSLLIARTLLAQNGEHLDVGVEKELLLINEANDAGVILYQIKKFGVDQDWSSAFAQLQLTRMEAILDYFNAQGASLQWNLTGQWLYCLLDWLSFREIYPWATERETLQAFVRTHSELPWVVSTDPRR
jgi:glutathione S-transferase